MHSQHSHANLKTKMTPKELAKLVAEGSRPLVQFGKGIENQESYLEPNMRGRIISVENTFDNTFRFEIDINEFETHNKSLESRNYYDEKGVPCLTATERGLYPRMESKQFM
jgi:hypothetical protein